VKVRHDIHDQVGERLCYFVPCGRQIVNRFIVYAPVYEIVYDRTNDADACCPDADVVFG
jgi:hypothetical protein